MNVGLYRTTGAIEAAERQLELVTTNLANVSTPGFKRHLGQQQTAPVGQTRNRVSGVTIEQRIDFSQGSIQRTGAALDLALEGDGFFEVEGSRGPLYTRNGRFRLDGQGALVTSEGYQVAFEGQAATIDPSGAAVLVGPDGTLSQGLNVLGRLTLVSFPAQDRLSVTSEGFFRAPASLRRDVSAARVHQGAIEASNAGGIEELVAMVSVQRSHERATNVLRMIDQSYRRLHQGR